MTRWQLAYAPTLTSLMLLDSMERNKSRPRMGFGLGNSANKMPKLSNKSSPHSALMLWVILWTFAHKQHQGRSTSKVFWCLNINYRKVNRLYSHQGGLIRPINWEGLSVHIMKPADCYSYNLKNLPHLNLAYIHTYKKWWGRGIWPTFPIVCMCEGILNAHTL